jgi:hypothetical protein
MDVSVLTKFVTLMLAISLAAERMVEVLKDWLPNVYLFKTNTDPTKESRRVAWIHLLAGVFGGVVAWVGKLQVLPELGASSWKQDVLAGLLASFGSAAWNHLLDLLKATKIRQEQAAIGAVALTQQKNLLNDAHPASFSLAMTKSNLLAIRAKRAATISSITKTSTIENPGIVPVNISAGEYLKFIVTDQGPEPTFTMSDPAGIIFAPAVASPQGRYEWFRWKDPADPRKSDILVVTLLFLGNKNYTYKCELWNPQGLKKTIFDIAYQGAPTDHCFEDLEVEIQ